MDGKTDPNSVRLQAADRLGKYYGLWDGRGYGDEFAPVIIFGANDIKP
jgi:hypothetical protein